MLTNHAVARAAERTNIPDRESLKKISEDILYRRINVFVIGISNNNRNVLKVMVFGYGDPVFVVYNLKGCAIITVLERDKRYNSIEKMWKRNTPTKDMSKFFELQLSIMRKRGWSKDNPKLADFIHFRRVAQLTEEYRKGMIN